jgi:acyl-CoA reductase-like NAD-dependent aldehyde dehydrogenase
MSADTDSLVREILETGTLKGLPEGHYIGGKFVGSVNGGRMDSFDPGRGVAFAEFSAGDADDVDQVVITSRKAFATWKRSLPAERGRILGRMAALIRENSAHLAVVEALDSGKRLVEAEGDVRGAARIFEYYAGAADKLQGETLPLGPDYIGMTIHEPVGVVAQIIPWNYPLSTTARGVAPALAAGCAVIVKPAEQTPFTALMLAEIATQAGLPDGVLNVVTGTGAAVGGPLTAHPGIDHITFTGSVPTGSRVMTAAAQNITRVILELGGKSPVVVMADCDFERALDGVVGAIYENAGQICSGGSRLLIEASIRDRFLEALAARLRGLTLGHGLLNPDIGPVNSLLQLQRVDGHVRSAEARGNHIRAGGGVVAAEDGGNGWFFAPTVIEALSVEDPIARDEIFGPVLTVLPFSNIDEATEIANSTDYALVAGIFTSNLSVAHRFARDVDAGQVFINEYFAAGIEAPFGGNRKSGFGRGKGMEALKSYSKLKSIVGNISF